MAYLNSTFVSKSEQKSMETTPTTVTSTIFRTLNTIGKKFKGEEYSENLLNELDAELQKVSCYMGVNLREAVIFSAIFWLNCNRKDGIDISDISYFLQCDLIYINSPIQDNN